MQADSGTLGHTLKLGRCTLPPYVPSTDFRTELRADFTEQEWQIAGSAPVFCETSRSCRVFDRLPVGYRRPYVAAWLTEKDDFPVRTILLWVQKDGKGPRWIPDLRQWHRDDRMRGIASDLDLVDAVSGPTRNSGSYTIISGTVVIAVFIWMSVSWRWITLHPTVVPYFNQYQSQLRRFYFS